MRAITYETYGTPGSLRLTDLPTRDVGPGVALIAGRLDLGRLLGDARR